VSVVEVAAKYVAVTGPVKTPAPVTESGVPGEEVPIPRFPALVNVRSWLPAAPTTRKRSAICPKNPLIKSGIADVEVASSVSTALAVSVVVPIADCPDPKTELAFNVKADARIRWRGARFSYDSSPPPQAPPTREATSTFRYTAELS